MGIVACPAMGSEEEEEGMEACPAMGSEEEGRVECPAMGSGGGEGVMLLTVLMLWCLGLWR